MVALKLALKSFFNTVGTLGILEGQQIRQSWFLLDYITILVFQFKLDGSIMVILEQEQLFLAQEKPEELGQARVRADKTANV